jgi:hypothetical protein
VDDGVEDLTKVFVASQMLGFSGIIRDANTTSNSFDNVRAEGVLIIC